MVREAAMRIRSVRIRNFRSFQDETIHFDAHTCLLGPNGAGKSTVLAALNVFFQEPSSTTDVASLSIEDFHNGNTKAPVEITVTFYELPEHARQELSHYVRHNELIATAEAVFDPATGRAPVQRFGERLIFKKFAPFFEEEKNGAKVDPLRERFKEITEGIEGFPDVGAKPTKAVMMQALRDFEEANSDKCVPARSSDLFYGPTKGKHKLDPFIQWVHLPAVKEASEEAEEAGNTALGKLLQRTVRRKLNFDEALEALRKKAREDYDALLEKEQDALKAISERLAKRLATYSHSDASLEVVWLQGSEKSVAISEPRATIKAQEGQFKGSLPRFGHGLQRSFLLAILQELATLEAELEDGEEHEQSTLILACEEPELYQHPPQARHLANVLRTLSTSGNQVLLTTHSPYFVSGEAFEEIRLIRKESTSGNSKVRCTNFDRFSSRIADITGKKPDKPAVARAKLYAALQPERSEMFFCSKVILVEGAEDRAYMTSALMLEDKWDEVRRAGLHIVPADGKSGILQLLVIGQELQIPTYVVFDADGDVGNHQHRSEHERDNTNLMKALGIDGGPFPTAPLWADNCAVWPINFGTQVKSEIGNPAWTELTNEARRAFDPGVSLAKNPLLIAETLRLAWAKGSKPVSLTQLAQRLANFALG
jgi:putative ATP-dependent endonuclease of the OLD family